MAGLFCDGFFVAVLPVEPWKPHDRLHGIPGDDMQGERQDVDFPVAEKNDVLKMITSFFRNAKKGRNAYE